MDTLLERQTDGWFRADISGAPQGVDRKAGEAGVLYGYVVAQTGVLKSRRGEFDVKGLKSLVSLMRANPAGTKSRFTHPTLSADGLGKFLGRAKNPRLDGDRVRADLHFNKTALQEPPGGGRPLGDYVMGLAESDPDALSSSVVIRLQEEWRLDRDGKRMRDENGDPLPPLIRPLRIHASDIVDTGDAVDGLLSHFSLEGLPDQLVRQATALLSDAFLGEPRDIVRNRLLNWVERYVSLRFDEEPGPKPVGSNMLALRHRRLTARWKSAKLKE